MEGCRQRRMGSIRDHSTETAKLARHGLAISESKSAFDDWSLTCSGPRNITLRKNTKLAQNRIVMVRDRSMVRRVKLSVFCRLEGNYDEQSDRPCSLCFPEMADSGFSPHFLCWRSSRSY